MIGEQPTGALPGIVICATSHEGLQVFANGRRVRLAIIDDDGSVLAAGDDVAREAEAVALNNFRATMIGKGFLRTLSKPILPSGGAA
ncbi:MAG: hypothetical protein LWW96_14010 [Acidovorax sp.]|uniref:hypothetical protein n=1 Tax=Acidovorax sp. TaxID=1872122 RepID=UPI0025C490F3|nr:hypothetical protein [Acidovorax sp.]MCE1193257.1 hypothetical protein [Acidovorax sp.]